MIFALFGILIISVGTSSVFGDNESITVTTDRSSYSENEIISVSGEIKYLALGNQVTLRIDSPNGNVAYVGQMTIDAVIVAQIAMYDWQANDGASA